MSPSVPRLDTSRSGSQVQTRYTTRLQSQQVSYSSSLSVSSTEEDSSISNTNRMANITTSFLQAISELKESLQWIGIREEELRRCWIRLVELFETIKSIEMDMKADENSVGGLLADGDDAISEKEDASGPTLSPNTQRSPSSPLPSSFINGSARFLEEQLMEGRDTCNNFVNKPENQRTDVHSSEPQSNDFDSSAIHSFPPPSSASARLNRYSITENDTVQQFILYELQLSSSELESIIHATYRSNYNNLKKDIKTLVDKVIVVLELRGWWEIYFWWGREIVESRKAMRLVHRIVKIRRKYEQGVSSRNAKAKDVKGRKDGLMSLSAQDLHDAFNMARKERRSVQGMSTNRNVFVLEDVKRMYDDSMAMIKAGYDSGDLVTKVNANKKTGDVKGGSVKKIDEEEQQEGFEHMNNEDEDEDEVEDEDDNQNGIDLDTDPNDFYHAADNDIIPNTTSATIHNSIDNGEIEANDSRLAEDGSGYVIDFVSGVDEDNVNDDDISMPEISRCAPREPLLDLQLDHSSDLALDNLSQPGISPLQHCIHLPDLKDPNYRKRRRLSITPPFHTPDNDQLKQHQSKDNGSFRLEADKEGFLNQDLAMGLIDERRKSEEVWRLSTMKKIDTNGNHGRQAKKEAQSSTEGSDGIQSEKEIVPGLLKMNFESRDGHGKRKANLSNSKLELLNISSDSDFEFTTSPSKPTVRPQGEDGTISTDELLCGISRPTQWNDETLQCILSTFAIPRNTFILHPLAISLENTTFFFKRYWEFERIIGAVFHHGPEGSRSEEYESGSRREKGFKEGKEACIGHWTLVLVEPWQNCWTHFDSIASQKRYERVEIMMKDWIGRQLEQRKSSFNSPLTTEDSLPFESLPSTAILFNKKEQKTRQQRFSPSSSSISSKRIKCMQQSDGVSCGFFVASFCWWVLNDAKETNFAWFDETEMRRLLRSWVKLRLEWSNGHVGRNVEVDSDVIENKVVNGMLQASMQEKMGEKAERVKNNTTISRNTTSTFKTKGEACRDEHEFDTDRAKQDLQEESPAVVMNGETEKRIDHSKSGNRILDNEIAISLSLGSQPDAHQTAKSASLTQEKKPEHVQVHLGSKDREDVGIYGNGKFSSVVMESREVSQDEPTKRFSKDGLGIRVKINDTCSTITTTNSNKYTDKSAKITNYLSLTQPTIVSVEYPHDKTNENTDERNKRETEERETTKESEEMNGTDDSNLRELLKLMNTAKRKYDEFLEENEEKARTLKAEIALIREKIKEVNAVMELQNEDLKKKVQLIREFQGKVEKKRKVLGRFIGDGEETEQWHAGKQNMKGTEEDEVEKEVGEIKREMERTIRERLEKEIKDIDEKLKCVDNERLGLRAVVEAAEKEIMGFRKGMEESKARLRIVEGRIDEARGWIKRIMIDGQ
ncbi:hypothetical protein BELL_0991g00030 [Botrytis elliptica]|uniref:Uncharacterized protein n=1 Tax=Botrytis elliptica TaxID=278938 RepID=A0A4Z1IX17_9HELO|nr:hypothetical protein EAE99_011586 [Botrytis elliptica]TGO65921.1 hypothetical protein BELL_0991g00030 [Botrytis elliptica]